MPSKGVSVIGQISGATQAVDRMGLERSMLTQTRLNHFILISLILHLAVLIIQELMPSSPLVSATRPPIKVTYAEPKKKESELKHGTIIDAPKPEKIEKPKTSDLLASHDSRAHSNRKKTEIKKYQRKKTVVPKSAGVDRPTQKTEVPPQKSASQSKSTQKKETNRMALPLSDRGRFAAVSKDQQQDNAQSSLRSGSKGSLSLLDGFDPDKYAALDTNTEHLEDADDDETVSLDTTETKYASYFARIKHQIERVWTYPIEAAQRGISGQITLRFRISKDGNLLGVWLVDKSGHEILDFAALKAVKEAAPFYPFPLNIQKERLSILATFIYSPTYGLLNQ